MWRPIYLLLVFACLLAWSPVLAQLEASFGPATHQLLDYYPAINADAPVVVVIHGGGWKLGDKSDTKVVTTCERFNEWGFAAVAPNYQLSSDSTYSGFPQQLSDLWCALNWVQDNASSLNCDPENVALYGSSAGGHLAAMMALTQESTFPTNCASFPIENIDAVLAIAGVYSFEPDSAAGLAISTPLHNDMLSMVLDTNTWQLAQPIQQIDSQALPPFYLQHSNTDPVVSYAHSSLFFDALLAADKEAYFTTLDGLGHGTSSNPDHSPGFPDFQVILDSIWAESPPVPAATVYGLPVEAPAAQDTAAPPSPDTGIESVHQALLAIYPSPFQQSVNLRATNNAQVKLQIFDLAGRLVKQYASIQLHAGQVVPLDLGDLENGTWIVRYSTHETMGYLKLIKAGNR